MTFNFGSTFEWSGGKNINEGSSNLKCRRGTFNITGAATKFFNTSATLNNYSICNWSGTGLIRYAPSSGNPTINNYGTWNINTDADFNNSNSQAGVFNNIAGGIVNKNVAGTNLSERKYCRSLLVHI